MEPTQQPAPKNSSHKKIGIAIGAGVVFVVALIALLAGKKSSTTVPAAETTASDGANPTIQNPSTVVSTPTTSVAGSSSTTAAAVYKDGTYSATGSYISPGGPDHVGVTLTLSNDVVTDVTVTPEPGDGQSARYQAKFVSGYKQYVVGQNIDTIHLTKVSGSSLTPGGFDDALAQIKTEAAA